MKMEEIGLFKFVDCSSFKNDDPSCESVGLEESSDIFSVEPKSEVCDQMIKEEVKVKVEPCVVDYYVDSLTEPSVQGEVDTDVNPAILKEEPFYFTPSQTDLENQASDTTPTSKTQECETSDQCYGKKCDLMKHNNSEQLRIKSHFVYIKSSQGYIRTHETVHLKNKETKNKETKKCDICKKSYSKESFLQKHHKAVHSGVKHTCDICKKSFSNKSHMVTHHKSVHLGVRYTCDICEKSFTSKRSLVKHHEVVHLKVNKRRTCYIEKEFFYKKNFFYFNI